MFSLLIEAHVKHNLLPKNMFRAILQNFALYQQDRLHFDEYLENNLISDDNDITQ